MDHAQSEQVFCMINSFPALVSRIILTLFISLAFAPATKALDRPITLEEAALVNEISAHNSAIRTMVGRFIQIDSVGQQIGGVFFLERPDKIRFRYNPPSMQEIISVGKGFFIIDRAEKTKVAYPQDKIPLRQFLTDEIDLLSANMSELIVGEDLVAITLIDDTEIGRIAVTLIFDKLNKELQQWTLTEPNGNELTFSIYEIEKNVEIRPAYFFIAP